MTVAILVVSVADVVMTYITKEKLVSFLIITHNRCEDLAEVLESILNQNYSSLEVIVIDNNSTDKTEEMFRNVFYNPNIRYIKMSENLGVSGGRNIAIAKASGEILITLDDDAILRDSNSTRKIVDRLNYETDVGILAFKIVNYYTGDLQKNAFPNRNKKRNPDIEFETTWYIGAGHAIKREVYKNVGMYGDFNPWGSEELDFSLRAIDFGYKIIYFPSVTVHHKISPKGRISSQTQFKALALKNRVKAAVLNLPFPSVLGYLVVRSGQILWVTRGNFRALLLAYSWLIGAMPSILKKRRPIGRRAIRKLLALRGPLFF